MKTGLALLLIGAIEARIQTKAVDLEPNLSRAIANKNYQAPTAAELSQAGTLFRRTLQGPCAEARLATDWAALGFELQRISTGSQTLWLLSDSPGKETGRGWYLFRETPMCSLALEAPHARNDIHTGTIGLRLFLAGQARAFGASTITRHRADMAHQENTFFQAFTLAFANVCPTGLVVQLHGFESGNHDNTGAEIVASAGTRTPGPWLGDLVQRLRQRTSLPVLAYPQDTRLLGATQNAQGRALQQAGPCRFLHLELSKELRDRLVREAELDRAILSCLSTASPR